MSTTLKEQTLVEPCPTLPDVHRVLPQIAELPEVAAVHLFGSVAKQQAQHGSDIDLLVVIKDLDYENRKLWSKRISNMVKQSTGVPCDAVIRSTSEWHGRKRLPSSLETHVVSTGIALYEDAQSITNYRTFTSSNLPETNGGALANSDMEDAVKRLREVSHHLNSAIGHTEPGRREISEFLDCVTRYNWEENHSYIKNIEIQKRQDRFVDLLDDCERILECGLKSLHHSLHGKYPERSHLIGKLARQLPNSKEKRLAQLIIDPLRVSRLPEEYRDMPECPEDEDFVNWRKEATYIEEEYNLYIPTSRVADYLCAAEQISNLALNEVLSDTIGVVLLDERTEQGTEYLKQQIYELGEATRTTDLEIGCQMSATANTDIARLLEFADTPQGQVFISPDKKRELIEFQQSQVAESHIDLIPSTVDLVPQSLSVGVCGARTSRGKPCQHPRPASGRRCAAGHLRT